MFRLLLVSLLVLVVNGPFATGLEARPSELLRIGIGSANTMEWEQGQDRLWVGGSQGLYVFNSRLDLVNQYTGLGYAIHPISWNPQNDRLATGDNGGNIRIFTYDGNALSQEPALVIPTGFDEIHQITWSPDSVYLSAVSSRREAGIWLSETGHAIALPQLVVAMPVTALEWNPANNSEIGFASLTEGITIWNTETQAIQQAMSEVAFNEIAWSQDSKLAAISGENLYVWEDGILGEPQVTTLDDGSLTSLDWSMDSESIVATSFSGSIHVWNTDGTDIQSVSGDEVIAMVRWSPNDDYLAVLGAADSLQIQDGITLSELARFSEFNSSVLEVLWHPNGQQVATIWGGIAQEIRIFDAQTGQMALGIPDSFTYTLAWNPAGTIIASSPSNTAIVLRDALSGEVLDVLGGGNDGGFLFDMDWNPDGTMLATSNGDDVSIWSLAAHEAIKRLEGHTDTITDVDWSPDGTLIASTGVDDTVRIWDASTGEQQVEFSGTVSSTWSPDGTHIASLDPSDASTIQIRETQNFATTLTLLEAEGVLQNIAWNADGSLIAAGSSNHRVYIWDAVDGELLYVIDDHTGVIHHVDWHPTMNLLAIASQDGTVTIWSL